MSNAQLEAHGRKVIAAMGGKLVMPAGEYGCWCRKYSPRGHWGMTYPENTARDSCGESKYPMNAVCVSKGLNTAGRFRGYTMVHESGHLYLARLGEKGFTGMNTYSNEDLTDCFAKIQGAPLLNNLPGYGCKSKAHFIQAQQLIKKYPPTTPWNSWK